MELIRDVGQVEASLIHLETLWVHGLCRMSMVRDEHTIGSEIILSAPDGTLR
jgi:hypothetical protein